MTEHEPSSHHDHKSTVDGVLTFDSTLLTPPLSIDDAEPPPFKPLDSDKVSLSMKKSGPKSKPRRRLNRACASSGDVNEERKWPTQAEHSLSRKSLPDLRKYKRPAKRPVLSEPGNHAWVDQKLQQLFSERGRGSSNAFSFDSKHGSDLSHRPRRWTFPSKARPTHLVCLTNHMSTATSNKSSAEQSPVTPAMIVLRRATTKKERAPSIAPTNITFFPPPKFSRTSTPLLSFLRMASQHSEERISCVNTNASMTHSSAHSRVPSPPRRPSVTKECAQPGCSVTADPAVTDVLVYSAREEDATNKPNGSGHRRFSTKIVSQNSVHEIIWDENVISGESNSSSSNISRKPTTDKKRKGSSQPRKQSIAVEQLETQLRRDSVDPRRGLPENPSELHRTHQTSFQSLLNFKFGEAKVRAGDLKRLPRSRASLSSAAFGVHDPISANPRRKTQHAGVCNDMEFFPALLYRASHRSVEHPDMLEHGLLPDCTAYYKRKSSMGRSLGQCNHMRRKSAANYYHRVERAKDLAIAGDDHVPLLSQTGLDGASGTADGQPRRLASSYQSTSAADADRSDPRKRQPVTSVFHTHRKRSCEAYELRNHKKCVADPDRKAQTSQETGSLMNHESVTVFKDTGPASGGWFTRNIGRLHQHTSEGQVVGQNTQQPAGKLTDEGVEGDK